MGCATPPECNDFGLRNIAGDDGNWGFFTFKGRLKGSQPFHFLLRIDLGNLIHDEAGKEEI